jgi:carbonic anhydrase
VIKWNSKYIKFHYPSEHTYNGTRHDVEMQIYHEVSSLYDNII